MQKSTKYRSKVYTKKRKQLYKKNKKRETRARVKKGGNLNAEFERRKERLENNIQEIIDNIPIPNIVELAQETPNININRIINNQRFDIMGNIEEQFDNLRDEATAIDNYFGNDDMIERIESSINFSYVIFDEFINNQIHNRNNNNNNNTIVSSYNRLNNSNSNSLSRNYNSS